MRYQYDPAQAAAFGVVVVCWVALIAYFVVRRVPKTRESRRDRASLIGLSLQGVAFVIVWSARRPPFTPILSTTRPVEILIAAATALLAAASLWLTVAAIKALGKQWSLSARLIEGHELVVEGPYRLARHPIYTGTLGMLMATGLSFSHWMALLLSIPIFAAGTLVRIRIEERLLRERFGARYDAYAKRVAAIVPFLI